jgi:hypothetical protein
MSLYIVYARRKELKTGDKQSTQEITTSKQKLLSPKWLQNKGQICAGSNQSTTSQLERRCHEKRGLLKGD